MPSELDAYILDSLAYLEGKRETQEMQSHYSNTLQITLSTASQDYLSWPGNVKTVETFTPHRMQLISFAPQTLGGEGAHKLLTLAFWSHCQLILILIIQDM